MTYLTLQVKRRPWVILRAANECSMLKCCFSWPKKVPKKTIRMLVAQQIFSLFTLQVEKKVHSNKMSVHEKDNFWGITRTMRDRFSDWNKQQHLKTSRFLVSFFLHLVKFAGHCSEKISFVWREFCCLWSNSRHLRLSSMYLRLPLFYVRLWYRRAVIDLQLLQKSSMFPVYDRHHCKVSCTGICSKNHKTCGELRPVLVFDTLRSCV